MSDTRCDAIVYRPAKGADLIVGSAIYTDFDQAEETRTIYNDLRPDDDVGVYMLRPMFLAVNLSVTAVGA